ncbi:hypothetical protein MLD38_006699 [Melastoma candidum]|uniref:Uncharacterized protein n=1 Tax=Melastoma candidum TaxID=119954 RepID=A0ACB9RNA4_9MYRT|nr:hypothetical protein MLD38_006699 [Melastoma candidum]
MTLQKIDARLNGLLAEASSEEDFNGKAGQSVFLRLPGISSKRVGLFGLGQSASNATAFKSLGEAVAAAAKTARASALTVLLASLECLSAESKRNAAFGNCDCYIFVSKFLNRHTLFRF